MKHLSLILVLMFGLLAGWSSTAKADVYLVAAGIADYPGTVNDLNLPTKDARAINNLYKKNAHAHTVLLLNEKATVDNIVAMMNSFYSQAKEDDIVVFYFSGHGSPGCFIAYDGQLKYSEIRKAMANSSSKNKMIFADACFSGDIREEGTDTHSDLNVMLFLSSRQDETSMESPNMKNGFFTECLVRCLKGGADVNRDRIITAKELFTAVRAGVIELSNDKQHPVMWGNFDDNMPVMTW